MLLLILTVLFAGAHAEGTCKDAEHSEESCSGGKILTYGKCGLKGRSRPVYTPQMCFEYLDGSEPNPLLVPYKSNTSISEECINEYRRLIAVDECRAFKGKTKKESVTSMCYSENVKTSEVKDWVFGTTTFGVIASYWEGTSSEYITLKKGSTQRCIKYYRVPETLVGFTTTAIRVTFDVEITCREKPPNNILTGKWEGYQRIGKGFRVASALALMFLALNLLVLILCALVVWCCPQGRNPKGKVFYANYIPRTQAADEHMRDKKGKVSRGAQQKAKMLGWLKSMREGLSVRSRKQQKTSKSKKPSKAQKGKKGRR